MLRQSIAGVVLVIASAAGLNYYSSSSQDLPRAPKSSSTLPRFIGAPAPDSTPFTSQDSPGALDSPVKDFSVVDDIARPLSTPRPGPFPPPRPTGSQCDNKGLALAARQLLTRLHEANQLYIPPVCTSPNPLQCHYADLAAQRAAESDQAAGLAFTVGLLDTQLKGCGF